MTATERLDAKPIEYGGSFFREGVRWFRIVFHMEPEVFDELEPSAVHGWIMATFDCDKWQRVEGRPGRTCVEIRAREVQGD